MTILAIYPGVLTTTAGLNPVLTTDPNGFPDRGLEALHLFKEASGTASTNERGGAAGLVEHPNAVNNSFAWLAGGGIRIDGTEIVSFPAFDVTAPWTLAYAGALTGSVGGTATERITGLIGFRDFVGGSNFRGALMAARGSNDWNTPGAVPYYQHRAANGSGGQTASENLLPMAGMNIIGSRRVHVMSYDGVSSLRSAIYDKLGALISEDVSSVTDAQLTTGTGGTVITNLKPIIGGTNASYAGGTQQAEVFARWGHVLTASDIKAVCIASAAIGAARGRPW